MPQLFSRLFFLILQLETLSAEEILLEDYQQSDVQEDGGKKETLSTV